MPQFEGNCFLSSISNYCSTAFGPHRYTNIFRIDKSTTRTAMGLAIRINAHRLNALKVSQLEVLALAYCSLRPSGFKKTTFKYQGFPFLRVLVVRYMKSFF